MSNYIKKVFCGIVIGVAAIMPGVSGSVIATSLGIYKELLEKISLLNKEFKANIIWLLPYIAGGIAGVVFFSNVLKYFISYSYFELMYIFTGLIFGTVPYYISDSNKFGFKKVYPVTALISFALFVFLFRLPIVTDINIDNRCLRLIISGAVLSLGTIIPGLSSSLLLMKFGLYNEYIDIVSGMKIIGLLYIALGFLLVSFLLVKFVAFICKKAYGIFSYFVLGLLFSSIIEMFPGFRNARMAVVDISLLYISFIMSFLLMSFRRR